MDEITNKTSLAGRVALITGAGRGIGAAIAAKIARMGATVVLAGRTRGPLESTADAIVKAGGQAEAVVCDVMHFSSVEPLAAHVDKTFGRLEILVKNAGLGGFGGLSHHIAPECWGTWR